MSISSTLTIFLCVLYFLSDHSDPLLRFCDLFFEFLIDSLDIFELLFDHEPMISLQDLLVDEGPPRFGIQLVIEIVFVSGQSNVYTGESLHAFLLLLDFHFNFRSQLTLLLLLVFSLQVVIKGNLVQVHELESDGLLTQTVEVLLVKLNGRNYWDFFFNLFFFLLFRIILITRWMRVFVVLICVN